MPHTWKAGLAGLALILASTSSATSQQQQQERDLSGLSAQQIFQLCLDENEDHGGCVGVWAFNCEDEGATTEGRLRCYTPEVEYWKTRMDQSYREVKGAISAEDVDPTYPLEQQLDIAQRAWVSFKEGTCGFEAMTFQGGTEGRVAFAHCELYMTAGRALDLEELWAAPEAQTQP